MNPLKHSSLKAIVLVGLASLLMAGCSGVATREIEAERVALHSEPVSMTARDLPEASIDSSGAVQIGKDELALTDDQRALTRDYRDAVIDLVDLTLDETSRLTDHAMTRVIFAMLIGRADEAGEKIGKQAEALVHSPPFCQRLSAVQQRQQRMTQSVVQLQPYAKISPQDVENCVAGKPYDVSI
jgi:hypothetical protein